MKNMILSMATVILVISIMSMQATMADVLVKKIFLTEAAKDCAVAVSQEKKHDSENMLEIARKVLSEKGCRYSNVNITTKEDGQYVCFFVEIKSEKIIGKYVLKKIKQGKGEVTGGNKTDELR